MSLIPAFQLGLLNAWILIIPEILLMFIGNKTIKKREMLSVSESLSESGKRVKNLLTVLTVPIFGAYFYSIFLPLKLITVWFYIGLCIYLLGFSVQITAWKNLATSSVDKPVTKGVYRFSRNPMYIGEFFVYLGITIACISWIFLFIVIDYIALSYVWARFEEQECLKKYGDSYREYMNRIPRWIGRPKSVIS
ncbi:hypothetical protein LCGC14_0835620 [marine sediment metagenome]|uniref:Steroid 5-alpha reductase C-terminal domain-containing protein n=1 Tax=marine sediment metagenome TaxID=412755 RepID=A0A0F9RZE6_9ZZZZ|nr:isoprenylcysteine carboxylmethyltransferase family protein [archaeon]